MYGMPALCVGELSMQCPSIGVKKDLFSPKRESIGIYFVNDLTYFIA